MHPEAGPHVHRTLQHIRKLGKKPGVVLNPGTPIDAIDNLMDLVDLILIMTVNPGFGGQSFIESQLKKIEAARKRIDARPAATSRWKSMAASRRRPRSAPSPPAPTCWSRAPRYSRAGRTLRRQYRRASRADDGARPVPLNLLPEMIQARCVAGACTPLRVWVAAQLVLSPPAERPAGRPYRLSSP